MSSITDYNYVSVFTPEGKVKPLDYIKKTVELGNVSIALKNNECGVMIGYKGQLNDISYYNKKVYKINDSSLFTFSGITNDGLEIVDYLIRKSVSEEVIRDRNISHLSVFDDLCVEASFRTMYSGTRLYGVSGLLMTQSEGIRLIEFEPTGRIREAHAMSIGNRSQSARTILESEVNSLNELDLEGLIRVGIAALKNAHPESGALNQENVDIFCLKDGKTFSVEAEKYLE
ncbi:subunit of 20S proteasome [Hamiltosporidium magnivora]|uniref:Subunit of 20S proteasome n=1 Tax=Hamiltosporidium magnivora TaxID=148818 RepID=A0A4Q9L6S6_9MICR|nr:subunit of 20S proteasome [Hamiltosporidium magnivora]